jgi:hypothetical protein
LRFGYDNSNKILDKYGLFSDGAWSRSIDLPQLIECYNQIPEREETCATYIEFHVGCAVRTMMIFLEERSLFPQEGAFLYVLETVIYNLEKFRKLESRQNVVDTSVKKLVDIFLDLVHSIKRGEMEAINNLRKEMESVVDVYLSALGKQCGYAFAATGIEGDSRESG